MGPKTAAIAIVINNSNYILKAQLNADGFETSKTVKGCVTADSE
jgi:hypothetical protein